MKHIMEGNEPSQSLAEQLHSARAARDLNGLHDLLSDIASGRRMPELVDAYAVSKFIRDLKGLLEHTDTRGWKKSGKITRDAVINLCRRALEGIDSRFVCRDGERVPFGMGLKKINTGAFPARLRTRGH